MFDFVTLFSDLACAMTRLTAATHNLAETVEQRTGAPATAPQSPTELPAAQPVKVRKKPGRKPRVQPVETNGAPVHVEPVLS